MGLSFIAKMASNSRTDRHSLSHFLMACNNIIQDSIRLLQSDERNDDYIMPMLVRLESLSQNVFRLSQRFPVCSQLLENVQSIIHDIKELKRESRTSAYRAPTSKSGNPGRPTLNISEDQLVYLIDLNFNCTLIARMLNVSRSTIVRRIRYFQLTTRNYSNIDNDDLDKIIKHISDVNPHLGYRSMQARLKSEGHNCQETRVRDSLIRVNPASVAMRWSDTIKRRSYRVRGPNSLWHIDGNHKLIRYKFVIHGGIDGYSRLIVFLNVATNNKAETVLKCFLSATQKYGIPSRVRSDKGIENVHVATFMEMYRGEGRGSMIQGRSVHNQRIERLWVDVYQGCTNVFYDLFRFMENQKILDVDNEVHIWALHYVFTPRILRSLSLFTEQWNNHKIRTENGKTPKQLFVEGALLNVQSDDAGACDLFSNDIELNITDTADANPSEETDNVMPEIEEDSMETVDASVLAVVAPDYPLSDIAYSELVRDIDPLSDEGDQFGLNIFLRTCGFISDQTQHQS